MYVANTLGGTGEIKHDFTEKKRNVTQGLYAMACKRLQLGSTWFHVGKEEVFPATPPLAAEAPRISIKFMGDRVLQMILTEAGQFQKNFRLR